MKKIKFIPCLATETDFEKTKNCDLYSMEMCPCFGKIGDTVFKLIEGHCEGNCLARFFEDFKNDYEKN